MKFKDAYYMALVKVVATEGKCVRRKVGCILVDESTIAPCLVCVKMLMNTGCTRIVFAESYAYPDAERLWTSSGREWVHFRP